MRTLPAGTVPSVEQLTAQHKRAAATAGVWLCLSATLQQSMSPIAPPMLHDSSWERRGMPAKALPASISKSPKEINRFFIVAHTLGKRSIPVKLPLHLVIIMAKVSPRRASKPSLAMICHHNQAAIASNIGSKRSNI